MTPAELADLTARAERLDRILRALRAFKDCRYELDVAAAERDLQAALAGDPNAERLPARRAEDGG
jgi:phosphopantetheine adenylyltransferase